MENKKIIKKDGYYCIIEKNEEESYEDFIERCNFIVSQKSMNYEDFEKSKIYSKIWLNNKNLNCIYSKEIMNQLNLYKKNLLSII
jgi:hypothetical protein